MAAENSLISLALALLAAAALTTATLPARILRLLAGLVPTALLLAWLLIGVLGLLALVILVLVGHSAISCVEPFNSPDNAPPRSFVAVPA
jgi:hypothetical protein